MTSTATTATNPAIDELKNARQKSSFWAFCRADQLSASPAIPTPMPPSKREQDGGSMLRRLEHSNDGGEREGQADQEHRCRHVEVHARSIDLERCRWKGCDTTATTPGRDRNRPCYSR